ncbi:MAG TPA: DNA polymerase Y family protein [Cyclobacteriaceae bacterium]|nr:DNA polymerase Y family protein [Cyclobacteriaceae bacterium]
MARRFISIFFRHLATDWFSTREPESDFKKKPFILRAPSHGRMIISAANAIAESKGIHVGMAVADARALVPELQVKDDKPDLIPKLLHRLAEWCIRFTPIVAVDPPDGLMMDVTGCSHLWGGDEHYLKDITKKLNTRGYDVRVAIADTAALAWGVARFGKYLIANKETHFESLMSLPPEGLRLEEETVYRLHKLGLHKVSQFIKMPRQSLRKRFGPNMLSQIDKATGQEIEVIEPVIAVEPYQERLPCMDPIVTATGIEIALKELLTILCLRLQQEQKGLRVATLKCYRVDGKIEQVSIGTNRPSHHVQHLFKLFELKIATIEPALGIELFVLEAPKVDDHLAKQEKMWEGAGGLVDERLSELIDRLAGKVGIQSIHRYLPDEHYWPERSIRQTSSLHEQPATEWPTDRQRPMHVLLKPEPIEVTAPIPDYPPMLFRHNGQIHQVVRADGPERIEKEWWVDQGEHRDYYRVEDSEGGRYWVFRLGHYDDKVYRWFLHGYFA